MKTHVAVAGCALAALLLAAPLDSVAQGGRGGPGPKAEAKAPAPKLGPVTGNAARGRELYYAHGCYGCHGFNGETGARDLVGTNSALIASEQAFIAFLRLRADQAPLAPSTRMPNYPASALSDRDAKDIYAYIRSFRLNAPDVEDVPTLKKILQSAERPYKP